MSIQGRSLTLAEVLLPASATAWWRDWLLIAGGSLWVALSAQVAIPLPFTPVPITGQTFGVLLVGFALGARRGAASLVLYLVEGAAGLPVFAGATGGMARLWGPTGGYLFGFVAAAALTGYLAERGWDRRVSWTFLGMALGNAVIYLCGLPWLAHFVGEGQVWAAGLLPFLAGDGLKAALAAALLPFVWQVVRGQSEQLP
ncbi:MAG TPA: biotin transporter BioY [Armatimonadetes bacterium]|nr:biotin transporter BioY [Armatimonadota bacterium]